MTIKSKGVYVVSEPGCMNPSSGAWRHISMGIAELSKHFEIETILPDVVEADGILESPKKGGPRRGPDSNRLRGSLRDLKVFLQRSCSAFKLLKEIKKRAPDFVYYRASYLHPLPLLLKLYGIPCFVEANGLQFEGQKMYYASYAVKVARCFEKWLYRSANHVFFVGSYGAYWKLSTDNWTNVENGVEQSFLDRFPAEKVAADGPVHICFVGHLMKHHQPEVFVEAIKKLAKEADIKIHLIGSQLDALAEDLGEGVVTELHGFLTRDGLVSALEQMDIGVIPGAPEYASQMKLSDYGAARLAVVAPDVYHLKHWYPEELVFFRSGDGDSLYRALADLIRDPDTCAQRGNSLHQRLKKEMTWDVIFGQKAEVIQKALQTKK